LSGGHTAATDSSLRYRDRRLDSTSREI